MKLIDSIDIGLCILEASVIVYGHGNRSRTYITVPNLLPISIPVNFKNDPILWDLQI